MLHTSFPLTVMGFSGGSVVRNLPANAGDMGSIPGSGRYLGEGNSNPLPVFLPGKSHGQRSPEGYSPWGCKLVGHNLATKQQLAILYTVVYSVSATVSIRAPLLPLLCPQVRSLICLSVPAPRVDSSVFFQLPGQEAVPGTWQRASG